jgi:hypothetical protein
VGTWHDPDTGRPIAAPLERCAELLDVDLATIRKVAANIQLYIRADGIKVWSLMQLERQLRPEAYGRQRGRYVDCRRTPHAHAEPLRYGPSADRGPIYRELGSAVGPPVVEQ